MAGYAYRTVVDTAATSRALVAADTVFAEIGITSPTAEQTTQMESVILQASALVEGFLDRVLAEEDVTDHFRELSGDTLRLSRWPVSEILEIDEDGTALTTDDWELDEATGQLWRISSSGLYDWATPGTTTISYTGGYALPDDLPADIQRAVIDQIKFHFFAGDRDPALRSLDIPGVAAETYAVAGGSSLGSSGLLVSVEGALARYRRMTV
jgi:hypothetical protein